MVPNSAVFENFTTSLYIKIIAVCSGENLWMTRRNFLHHFQRRSLKLQSAGSFPVKVVTNTSSLAHLPNYRHYILEDHSSRTQWPRCLRHGFTAAGVLGLGVRISPRTWMTVCCECCVLSGRGLCDGLIPHPVCMCVCACVCVIRCNNSPLQLQWVGRRGQNWKKRKN
jgi:hypothetical protein